MIHRRLTFYEWTQDVKRLRRIPVSIYELPTQHAMYLEVVAKTARTN